MLHIVNKSPLERNALESCLRVAQGGALLLTEDAVYAAMPPPPASPPPWASSRFMCLAPTSMPAA